MIELKAVSKKYIKSYYTLFNANAKIDSPTIIIDADYGATCLFRLISKIDKTSEGDIFVDNKNIKEIKDKDLNLCYLPQMPILFENKSIYKNLMYPLNLRKFNKKLAKNIVNNAFLQFNFKNNKQKVKSLTLSEKKLIALIRGSLWQPRIMLLENFFENLTPTYFNMANELINKISQSTLILASEKQDNNMPCYKNFKRIKIENGELKL